MKKKRLIGLLAVLALSGACTHAADRATLAPAGVGLPNPFTSYGSPDEARAAFGGAFPLPRVLPAGFQPVDMAVADAGAGRLAQIRYEHGAETLVFRAVRGWDADGADRVTALSGDYRRYPEESVWDVNGTSVITRGEGGVSVACWARDGMDMCLTAAPALTPEQARLVVENVR